MKKSRKLRGGLAVLAGAGLAGGAAMRRRRRASAIKGAAPQDAEISMGDMTRKLATEQPPVQEGSGTIPSSVGSRGGNGMSANDSVSGQPLDARMAQQFHQPAQGTEGGHANGADGHTAP